jgi:hypothetical protein
MNGRSYLLSIEGPLFRKQRELLIGLVDSARSGRPCRLDSAQIELLEGLIGLTDSLADQAHDRHGIDCLIS